MALKNITPEQRTALMDIWSQIGGNFPDDISQIDTIELVLDSNRPKVFYPEVDWSDFYRLTYEEQIEALKQIFTEW